MKICFAWFVALVLLPCAAFAKRAAPEKVQPVVHQGVRYIAPNDDGRRACIEAWDVQTNKKLWELTVFTNRIDPKLEEDVQWVYIKALMVRDGTLIVTSERGKTYRIDMKTKAVHIAAVQQEPVMRWLTVGVCVPLMIAGVWC